MSGATQWLYGIFSEGDDLPLMHGPLTTPEWEAGNVLTMLLSPGGLEGIAHGDSDTIRRVIASCPGGEIRIALAGTAPGKPRYERYPIPARDMDPDDLLNELQPSNQQEEHTMTKNEETNTTAGHTPGPWEIEEAEKGTKWGIYPAHNRYPCQQPIAQGWASDISEWHVSMSEANARLIAAAPDMLEFLKDYAGKIPGMPNGGARFRAKFPHIAEEMDDLIAKAEGGAS